MKVVVIPAWLIAKTRKAVMQSNPLITIPDVTVYRLWRPHFSAFMIFWPSLWKLLPDITNNFFRSLYCYNERFKPCHGKTRAHAKYQSTAAHPPLESKCDNYTAFEMSEQLWKARRSPCVLQRFQSTPSEQRLNIGCHDGVTLFSAHLPMWHHVHYAQFWTTIYVLIHHGNNGHSSVPVKVARVSKDAAPPATQCCKGLLRLEITVQRHFFYAPNDGMPL